MSRASRDAAAAAEIRFGYTAYHTRKANVIAFARRNADRVTSLGDFVAPNFVCIRKFNQLQDLDLTLGAEIAKIALLPRSLTKLVGGLHSVRIDWRTFGPLRCLQELQIYTPGLQSGFEVQLDDSFATALPLLRVFVVSPGVYGRRFTALKTTAKVAMPHLVELTICHAQIVHLDLHFMSALKSLRLLDCTVLTVFAACSDMVLKKCLMRNFRGTMLVTPNLSSLTIDGGGLHKLDGSRCRHASSTMCMYKSSVEWVGARPNVAYLGEM